MYKNLCRNDGAFAHGLLAESIERLLMALENSLAFTAAALHSSFSVRQKTAGL